jgi:hypothetical protein
MKTFASALAYAKRLALGSIGKEFFVCECRGGWGGWEYEVLPAWMYDETGSENLCRAIVCAYQNGKRVAVDVETFAAQY